MYSCTKHFIVNFKPLLNPAFQPIGIFDSGIGGMTIAHAIKNILPNESIVYFGDTAHFPYGDKSATEIRVYAQSICDVLLKKNCKVILIACNSASAVAYHLLTTYVNASVKILNVIDPVIDYVGKNFQEKSIGLIGTQCTIQSGTYTKKIEALKLGIQLKALATPLLAPMIESGAATVDIKKMICSYLTNARIQQIDALILGCTHYPIIQKHIEDFYQNKVCVIDAVKITVEVLKKLLITHRLINTGAVEKDQFFVSSFSKDFDKATQLFFTKKVRLEQVNY